MKRLTILIALMLAALAAPHRAAAADYTIIQYQSCASSNHIQVCPFTNPVVAGDAIICVVFGRGIQYPSAGCNDNLNPTYTQAATAGNSGATAQINMEYVLGSLGGSITVNCQGSGFDGFMCSIFEVRGQTSFSNLLDQHNASAPATGNTIATGNITTTVPSEIMFSAAFTSPNAATAPGWSNSAGWTQITNVYDGSNAAFVVDYEIVTSTGTYSNTFTATGASGDVGAVIAAFEIGSSVSSGAAHRAQVY